MDQPSDPEGSEQKAQNVSQASREGPPRVEMKEKDIEVSKRNLTDEDDDQDGCDENGDEKTDHGCASTGRRITWFILNLVLRRKQENLGRESRSRIDDPRKK